MANESDSMDTYIKCTQCKKYYLKKDMVKIRKPAAGGFLGLMGNDAMTTSTVCKNCLKEHNEES